MFIGLSSIIDIVNEVLFMSNETINKARIAQREYMRRWRAENRDKVRAAQERYWKKRGEKLSLEQAVADPVQQNTETN